MAHNGKIAKEKINVLMYQFKNDTKLKRDAIKNKNKAIATFLLALIGGND